MVLSYDPKSAPAMQSAKMALDTGNANYVLIWVPEESENKVKNLLEKTCCESSTQTNMQNRAIDWYFESVNRLFYANVWTHCYRMKSEGIDVKPIVLVIERAIESGNFDEIGSLIPNTREGDARQRFCDLMSKRNYDVNNIAAGRDYVTSFIDFIIYLHNLSPENSGGSGHAVY
jgi:hypothetical protein